MDFLQQLFLTPSVAQAVLVLGLVIALGLAIGSIRIAGINLGMAGVLFAGILFGHFKIQINHEIMEFAREFGLILFVYTIGMQVGPGFFESFKKEGVRLNILAAGIVLGGVAVTVLLHVGADIPLPAAVGMFSGATTNTPSLAAAQQALKEVPGILPEELKMPGLGYAVAYPFGIIGIILTMMIARFLFRLRPQQAAESYESERSRQYPPLEVMDFKVENLNLDAQPIQKIPALNKSGVVISRVLRDGAIQAALSETKIYLGDVLRAVGPKERLEELRLVIGSVDKIDFRGLKNKLIAKRVVITKQDVAGKTIGELGARSRYGVSITRLFRSEIEFPVTSYLEVHYGDTLLVVGEDQAIHKFSADMGNMPKHLDHPQLIPIFVGIALGVILGSLPFHLPGVPAPVKLGLAGGPLLVAILLSRIGRIGKLIWYMPSSANFMLREVGIALFLACVGLRSGDQFIHTLMQGQGFYWMACAALITFLPLMVTALIAQWKWKMNYLTMCGLLAGSMTDPPALAFANQMAPSSAQVVAYAAVYPLVMLLRVLTAQLIVIYFSHF